MPTVISSSCFILVIMYSLNVPGFITLSSVSPEIVYITSPFGAELNALDTVTDVALKELIALVSILRSSDQKV